jgi:tRNA threonylcarbamoyladenosine biosynthesis protein TsaB
MLLVSLDTSTRVCSVALHQDGALLASYELLTEKTHSSMLTTLVENAVTHAGFSLDQLDAVAVAKGPGSYTGLRIGVSTAKGLCFALDKPLVAVNTLEAMALQLAPFFSEEHVLCPLLDARRMEVYVAGYGRVTLGGDDRASGHNLKVVLQTQAKIIDETSFAEVLAERPVVFFGEGAAKCHPMLGTQPNAIFPEVPVYPSARTVGLLATGAFGRGEIENLVTFEPFYLKEFVGTVKKTD